MTAYLKSLSPQTETSLWRHSLRTWLNAQPGPTAGRDGTPHAGSSSGSTGRWRATRDDHPVDALGRGAGS